MSKSRLLFRTPADVRAIGNEQWEVWLRTSALPFISFAALPHTQMVLRYIIRATTRRMGT